MRQVWRGARVFDGWRLRDGVALVVEDGCVAGLVDDTGEGEDLGGGLLAPGFIDLQVNGGGGALLGEGDADAGLAAICAAHRGLGTLGLLPTLITASPEVTQGVIAAGIRAARTGLKGFLGLHLEGPHLDPRRKGAHDASLIRPLTDPDLALLIAAALALPALMITLAPEAASPGQIAALAGAGAIISLGHSDCTEGQARKAMAAGARCVTHLFNAMSPLGHRAPGLTGAALDGSAFVGIIPDGVHVARTPFRLAAAAASGRLFAVSDAMAVAGTSLDGFTLNGRTITRDGGRLTLTDGTLAGADVTLPQALRWMTGAAGLAPEAALAMVTRIPAEVLGRNDLGRLAPGTRPGVLHLGEDYEPRAVLVG